MKQKPPLQQLYGIWCHDANDDKGRWNQGNWLREPQSSRSDGGKAILAFSAESDAQRRAADHYGYENYTKVKKDGWCEVRPLT